MLNRTEIQSFPAPSTFDRSALEMDARSLPETLTFLLGIENVARGEPPLIIAAGGTIGPVANSIWPGIHNPGASGEPRQVSIQVPVLHPMLCLVSEPKPKVYTQTQVYSRA